MQAADGSGDLSEMMLDVVTPDGYYTQHRHRSRPRKKRRPLSWCDRWRLWRRGGSASANDRGAHSSGTGGIGGEAGSCDGRGRPPAMRRST
eukprot:scaffold4967_cov116-Isochrysis_galbana.AAC.16